MAEQPPSAVLHFDGGITKNPGGRMSVGWHVTTDRNPKVFVASGGGRVEAEFADAHRTNITAEFLGARAGLSWLWANAPERGYRSVRVVGDCQFVVKCLEGKTGTSKPHLRPLLADCRQLVNHLDRNSGGVTVEWVSRKYNQRADHLCRRDAVATLLPAQPAGVRWDLPLPVETPPAVTTAPARSRRSPEVTEEWLRSSGYGVDREFGRYGDGTPIVELWVGPAKWYDFASGGQLLVDHGPTNPQGGGWHLRTRKDVKRFCEALRIFPTKPTE
jgi:ribonuclease HI